MEKIITKHEAIRLSPSFQRLMTRCTAIAVLKDAERFEYRNTVHNDTWIFWKINDSIVGHAILGESAATMGISQKDGPDITYNDGQALGLAHLGTLAERIEGTDSGTWAVSLLPGRREKAQ
jgi:hypothetical protein